MRLVDRPAGRPFCCAALPQMGQTSNTRWIDTGTELIAVDPRIYLSEAAVREMVRVLGWASPEEYTALEYRANELSARASELEAKLTEADRFAESVKWTLGKFGEEVRNKPGRPKKEIAA